MKTTITICSSASHYKQALTIEKQLQRRGFRVLIPDTARVMQKRNDFTVSHYKTWNHDGDYSKKTMLMKKHFEKVTKADAILVTNFTKKRLRGYIGGNVLMEMTLAFYLKKPIFLFNDIDPKLQIKEEVYGLQPIILHEKLHLLTEHIRLTTKKD